MQLQEMAREREELKSKLAQLGKLLKTYLASGGTKEQLKQIGALKFIQVEENKENYEKSLGEDVVSEEIMTNGGQKEEDVEVGEEAKENGKWTNCIKRRRIFLSKIR